MRAIGLVVEGLAATADRARMDVVSHEANHLWPIELAMDVLDHLGNTWVASQVVVMTGVQDIQSGILVVRNIQ